MTEQTAIHPMLIDVAKHLTAAASQRKRQVILTVPGPALDQAETVAGRQGYTITAQEPWDTRPDSLVQVTFAAAEG